VVLRSPIPWALAAGQVLVAAFLFTLAALGPTQQAAVAAGLLAAAGFAVVWFSSRSILASSDPYEMATRYVAYLTRARGRSRKVILAQTKRMLRPKRRSPKLIELLSAPTQDSISVTFLMQFGEGMRSAFARGQAAAALTLWQGCVTLFIEHARDRGGAIGDYGGVTQALLELGEEAVERAEANQLYAASAQIIRTVAPIAGVRSTSTQYAMVLTTTRDLLSRQIDKKWDDERSFIPNAAAATIAAMAMSCFENGALDDGMRGLTVLGDLAMKATISRKVHISVAAIDGFVRALKPIVAISESAPRRDALGHWTEIASKLVPLRAIEDAYVSLIRPMDVLLPGISISGGGLAELLWEVAGDQPAIEDLTTSLLDWLDRALPVLCKMDRNDSIRTLDAGLTMVYNVALLAAGRLPTNAELAARIGRVLLAWTRQVHPYGSVGRIFLDGDVAELTWSTMIACGYLAESPQVVIDVAAQILGILSFEEDAEFVYDECVRSFIEGMLIVTDSSPTVIARVIHDLEPDEWWRGGGGLHIPGFGHAPSLNLNRSGAPPALVDAINRWALGVWPAFLTQPQDEDASTVHGGSQPGGDSDA
jgi:hypothetical protein